MACRQAGPLATVVVGGDCLLARSASTAIPPSGDGRWADIARACRGADAFAFNLETTVGKGGQARQKRFIFQAPPGSLDPIAELGPSVAALANNHSMDFGREGLLATIACLDAAGMAHAGGGANLREAWREARMRCPGGFVAVLSAGVDDDPSSFSPADAPVLAPIDRLSLVRRIAECASDSVAVVVMLHWGAEYDMRYTEAQRSLAHALVDAGASLVAGSGPHVLRGIESYHGGLVCYSLGNLVFDDLGSRETASSAIVRMEARAGKDGKAIVRFAVAPLVTRVPDGGPRRPSREEAGDLAASLAARSPEPEIFGARKPALRDGLYWFDLGSR